MASEKQFCYSWKKAPGNLVALGTTTIFIALKIWNNQLSQASFCDFFPLLLDYLNFVSFYFFSINQEQIKKNNVAYYNKTNVYFNFFELVIKKYFTK